MSKTTLANLDGYTLSLILKKLTLGDIKSAIASEVVKVSDVTTAINSLQPKMRVSKIFSEISSKIKGAQYRIGNLVLRFITENKQVYDITIYNSDDLKIRLYVNYHTNEPIEYKSEFSSTTVYDQHLEDCELSITIEDNIQIGNIYNIDDLEKHIEEFQKHIASFNIDTFRNDIFEEFLCNNVDDIQILNPKQTSYQYLSQQTIIPDRNHEEEVIINATVENRINDLINKKIKNIDNFDLYQAFSKSKIEDIEIIPKQSIWFSDVGLRWPSDMSTPKSRQISKDLTKKFEDYKPIFIEEIKKIMNIYSSDESKEQSSKGGKVKNTKKNVKNNIKKDVWTKVGERQISGKMKSIYTKNNHKTEYIKKKEGHTMVYLKAPKK